MLFVWSPALHSIVILSDDISWKTMSSTGPKVMFLSTYITSFVKFSDFFSFLIILISFFPKALNTCSPNTWGILGKETPEIKCWKICQNMKTLWQSSWETNTSTIIFETVKFKSSFPINLWALNCTQQVQRL